MNNQLHEAGFIAKKAKSNYALAVYCILRGLPVYTALYGGFLSFQREIGEAQSRLPLAYVDRFLTVGRRMPTLPIPGGKIRFPKSELVSLMVSIYQTFIQKEYETYPDYVPRRNDVVLDAGAYIGMWTIHVAVRVGPAGRVIAVEPHPQAFRQLVNNVRLNKLTNVIPLNCALGSSPGEIELYGEETGVAIPSSIYHEHIVRLAPYSRLVKLPAKMFTVDEVLRENNVDRVDLVKLDVEGSELEILRGAASSLRKGVIKRIVAEVHEDMISKNEASTFLNENGFIIEHIRDDPNPWCGRSFIYSRFQD